MNEKERIIDLVRQNVITMEEALTLLEAAGNKEDSQVIEDTLNDKEKNSQGTSDSENSDNKKVNFNQDKIGKILGNIIETGSNVTNKVADYLKKTLDENPKKADEESKDFYSEEYKNAQTLEKERFYQDNQAAQSMLEEEIRTIDADLLEMKDKMQANDEQLVINQQRLRELEIFAELDDLTEEMQIQKDHLQQDIARLEEEKVSLEEQKNQLQDRKGQLIGNQVTESVEESKEFIKNKAEDIGKVTAKIADEALREGKKVSKEIGKHLKDVLKNFDMKDVNLSFEVPWIKTYSMEHQFEFFGDTIDSLDFKLNNGSLTFETGASDKILIDGALRFHGNFDRFDVATFQELSTISDDQDTLCFHVLSPRLSADLKVILPDKLYKKVSVKLMNGDGLLRGIEAKELEIHNKNGKVSLEAIKSDFIDIMNLSGDITLSELNSQDTVIKTLSGDIRIIGAVHNLNAETTSGNIVITKQDLDDSHIQAKTMSGDIKISQNKDLNLNIHAVTNSGTILHRLEQIDSLPVDANQSKQEFHRHLGDHKATVNIDAKVVSGHIWLKDSKVEG